MGTAIQPGDVVVRHYVGKTLQLIDAATNEQIAIIPSVDHALKIASERAGAVWQEEAVERAESPALILLKPRTQL